MSKAIFKTSAQNPNILISPLDEIMGDRFGRYAKYIIQDRALPDVRDGLKPVQRRILYAMSSLGLNYDKPPKKSARIVGEVIGKYHPHGDSSVYEALVRMSQSWKLGQPLIEMQGNNGSIDGDNAAAMRYTEVRLAKISNLLLADLDQNTVPFVPNFDDSEREPTVLPAYFPNILVNGAAGIAAGYATNIPPHNLRELLDAVIKVIENPRIHLEKILEIVQGPDFPTGGVIQGRDGIREAFATGRGKVIVNARWHFEDQKLVIDEIPYEIIKQDLVRKVGDVIDANPDLGIEDIRDETDRQGLRLVIELEEKANPEVIRKFLFKNTPLAVSYNYNNVVIVDKQPKLLGILPILHAYANHYRQVLTRKSEFEYQKNKRRLEIVRGLIKMVSVLDKVIKTIRQSLNRADAIDNLKKGHLGFSHLQAEAIVDMRLHRLTSTDLVKLQIEAEALETQLKHLHTILKNPAEMSKEIISRLREVKRNFPTPRRTTINEVGESLDVQIRDTLIERPFDLWISRDGYLKALDANFLAKNDLGIFGRKPNDLWISRGTVSNLDTLLLFSNTGTYYSLPLYKIPMSKWKEIGIHLNTLVTTNGPEKIRGALIVNDFKDLNQEILLTTKKGLIKRIRLDALGTKVITKGFKLLKLDSHDELVGADLIPEATRHVVLGTKSGLGMRYNLEDVPIQGLGSKGVKAANLKNDEIVFSWPATKDDQLLIFTADNRRKKIQLEELPVYVRPKKGIRLYLDKSHDHELLLGFVLKPEAVVSLLNQQNELEDCAFEEEPFSSLNTTLKTHKGSRLVDGAWTKLLSATPRHYALEPLVIKNSKTIPKKTAGPKTTKTSSQQLFFSDLDNGLSPLLGEISTVLKPQTKVAVKKAKTKTLRNKKNER